jgi:hypothetical protein
MTVQRKNKIEIRKYFKLNEIKTGFSKFGGTVAKIVYREINSIKCFKN